MKTLFTDLYNKILELFQIEHSENTSKCAADRLQVILMHDRTKLDPLIMSQMREELIDVFSKYVVIDKEELEIGLKNEGDTAALMLNIPIVRAKTEAELEELRKELSNKEEKDTVDEDSKSPEGKSEESSGENSEEQDEVIIEEDTEEDKIIEENPPRAAAKEPAETKTNEEIKNSD